MSKIIFLNMHELYSNGMCLMPPPNGIFTRFQLSGCGHTGQGLITIGGLAKTQEACERVYLDANEAGHLYEDDYTAGSQPDHIQ